MGDQPRTIKALVVVRTYPTPAKKGVEVSCTAAITDQGEWLRLFPVPYRLLPPDKRFHKYQWIEVQIQRANDNRPESHKLVQDSIKILSRPLPTENQWQARKDVVYPLLAHCMCCLQEKREKDGFPTLGVFKPFQVTRFEIQKERDTWTEKQLAILRQLNLFEELPAEELEKIPFKFSYSFKCDHDTCTGHTMMCADWEMAQAWREWSKNYKSEWEKKFRETWEAKMIRKNDTHFFVGTVRKHPGSWIIVGVFYPPYPPNEPSQLSGPNLFSELS